MRYLASLGMLGLDPIESTGPEVKHLKILLGQFGELLSRFIQVYV